MAAPETPLAPKPLPPVQRLSRAVLVAVAGLVTLTLLAVAFLATPRPLPRPQPIARPPAAAEPGFLQRPPANPPPGRREPTDRELLRRLLERGPQPPAGGRSAWSGAGGEAPDYGGRGDAPGYGRGGDVPDDGRAGDAPGDDAATGAGAPREAGAAGSPGAAPRVPAPAPLSRDLRREAFLRALHAPLAQPLAAAPRRAAGGWPPPPSPPLWPAASGGDGFDAAFAPEDPSRGSGASPWPDAAPSPPSPPGRGAPFGAAPDRAQADTTSPRSSSAAPRSSAAAAEPSGGAAAVPSAGAASVPLTGATALFTRAAAEPSNAEPRAAAGRLAPVIPAGTVIPALLLTEVNSDLPGPLMAQVSRDVYDLHQRAVVLPRGTRLLGRYDNRVAVGQRRLLVAWTRLQFLDGALLELPGLPGSDAGGAAGLPARVENHLLRVFGDAVLLSLLSAGSELAAPPPRSLVTAPSAGSVASAAAGQQLADAGLQLLRRDLAIQPTLRLPAGTPLTVFVNADLPLGAAPAGERR